MLKLTQKSQWEINFYPFPLPSYRTLAGFSKDGLRGSVLQAWGLLANGGVGGGGINPCNYRKMPAFLAGWSNFFPKRFAPQTLQNNRGDFSTCISKLKQIFILGRFGNLLDHRGACRISVHGGTF